MRLIGKLKSWIQQVLGKLGFRLVPADRDPASLFRNICLEDFKTVIDVGANQGDTVLRWLKTFPNAHVHAFEPLPQMQDQLKSIADRFPEKVTLWPVAASDRNGEARFLVHLDHPSSSSLLSRSEISAELFEFTKSEREIIVATHRLDSLLGLADHNALKEPVLLKLDVQGAELSVLRGATDILKKVNVIICEVNLTYLYNGQCSFSDLLSLVESADFQFAGFLEQFSLPDGSAVYVDAVFRRKVL